MTPNSSLPDAPTIEVEEDYPFQRFDWRAQRYGLIALAIAVAAMAAFRDGSVATLVRVTTIYVFLLMLFRLAGKRSLAQMTSFDLVLVMVDRRCHSASVDWRRLHHLDTASWRSPGSFCSTLRSVTPSPAGLESTG